MKTQNAITAFTSAAALSLALGGGVAAQGLDPLGSNGPSQEEYDAIQGCIADYAAPEDCIRDAMKPIYDERMAEFTAEMISDDNVTPEEEAGLEEVSQCAFAQMPEVTARHYPSFVLGYESGTNMELVSSATDAEYEAFKNLLRDSYNVLSGCFSQHMPQQYVPPVDMFIKGLDNFRALQNPQL